MIEGFKNREVVCDNTTSSLHLLSEATQRQYIRDGIIETEASPIECRERVKGIYAFTKRRSNMEILDILGADEYYGATSTVDNEHLNVFIDYNLGLLIVQTFTDNTFMVRCSNQEYTRLLFIRMLGNGRDCRMMGDQILVNTEKQITTKEAFQRRHNVIL
jgi:hypothetical protein